MPKERIFAFLIRIWLKTLRIRLSFPPNFSGGVVGIWHEDLASAIMAFKFSSAHALISPSSDGELLTAVASSFGYCVERGSSSGGVFAVKKLLKPLQEGKIVIMALDGPRGPRRIEKKGAAWLSHKTHSPLYRMNVRYGAHWTLKSWDRAKLPVPFSRVFIEIVLYFDAKKE